MNKTIFDHKAGFTLVELLITLGIFAVIMLVGSNFLIQTIRNANQAAVQNEVRQNASTILQGIVSQARQSYCVYYFVDASDGSAAKLRLSDDPNSATCASGNYVEYRQDMTAGPTYGVLSKKTYDAVNGFSNPVTMTSASTAILNCSVGALACGEVSGCDPGLMVSPSNMAIVNGALVAVTIWAQQIPGQTRPDYCAAIRLSDTVSPRVR